MRVEVTIVLTWAKSAILFGDKEKWESLRGFGWDYATGFQMFFDKCFTHFHLERVQRVYLGNLGNEAGLKVDDVIIWLVRWKFFMGFLQEHIFKVLTPFQQGCFLRFGFLGDLG